MGFEVHQRAHRDPRVRAAGLEALGLYTLAGSWSFKERYDGWVAGEVVRRWDPTLTSAGRLVTFDPWRHQENDHEIGYGFVLDGDEPIARFLRNLVRPAIPTALRAAVYERDGYACGTCGSRDRLSLDHIWPWSLGGADTFCRSCNSRKGARV